MPLGIRFPAIPRLRVNTSLQHILVTIRDMLFKLRYTSVVATGIHAYTIAFPSVPSSKVSAKRSYCFFLLCVHGDDGQKGGFGEGLFDRHQVRGDKVYDKSLSLAVPHPE